MNPNIPSAAGGTTGDPASSAAGPASEPRGSGPGAADAAANPYFTPASNAPPPDLDAAAPVLRSSEAQRVNRRALAFLAGILALIVCMIVLVVRNAASGEPSPRPAREESVTIPALPEAPSRPAEASPVEPVALASERDLPPLPLLPPEAVATMDADAPLREPTLAERRMHGDPVSQAATQDPYAQALMAGLRPQEAEPARLQPTAAPTSARRLHRPDTLLARGTYVRCVLETRIVTDVPGFTSCIVTEPIYSINGRRLLLPKGSKISGSYNQDANGPRVSVVWDRITTPTGIDVAMASPGVDNLGGAGHPGDYDAHWGSRVGAALMISLLGDAFRYGAAEYGPTTTTVSNGLVTQSPFESGTARTMERLANQALDRAAARPATVTIPHGTVLNVYVAKDVDFSAVLAPAP